MGKEDLYVLKTSAFSLHPKVRNEFLRKISIAAKIVDRLNPVIMKIEKCIPRYAERKVRMRLSLQFNFYFPVINVILSPPIDKYGMDIKGRINDEMIDAYLSSLRKEFKVTFEKKGAEYGIIYSTRIPAKEKGSDNEPVEEILMKLEVRDRNLCKIIKRPVYRKIEASTYQEYEYEIDCTA